MTADGRDGLREGEPRAGVRATRDHEQAGASGYVVEVERDLVFGRLGGHVDAERDRRALARFVLERRATRRAEVRTQRVAMPALVAEDLGHVRVSLRSARGRRRGPA